MLNTTLAQIRRLSEQFLLDSFEILTATRAVDSYGRESISFAVVATVKGQLSAASGSERRLLASLTDSGVANLETARLALPWATSITSSHYVRKAGSSEVWNVATVLPQETLGALVVALLTREAVADE